MLKGSESNEISIYHGALNPISAIEELRKLRKAFPTISEGFIEILTERLIENNFSDKRVKEAVANVIDNFTYQTPSIANIVSFDKRMKLYSRSDFYLELDKGRTGNDFFRVTAKGSKNAMYISKTDKIKFGISDDFII